MTDDQFAYFTPVSSNSVYRYQWNTEKWKTLPPSPFLNSGLVVIDGELTAVGGWAGSNFTTNKLFTLREGRWVEHYPPMNTARSDTAVVSISDGNLVFVIGGGSGDNDWTATVEIFDVRSKRWYELTYLPQNLSQPSATVCGSQLHVIGLFGDGYSCSLQTLLSSDTDISQSILNTLTWEPLPELPVSESTVATLCGQLVTVGGERGIHQLLDGQWVEIGSTSSVRGRCLIVTPSPDKMMIVGGWGGSSVEECVVV